MSLIEHIEISILNKYEEFTHWYWHLKPHRVKCIICKDEMRSNIDKYSPEECGWEMTKHSHFWICHRCLCHRDYTPYVKQADEEEYKKWEIANEELS